MTATRPRNASQTRADILSAARRRFAAEGYERTTLRAIAADVGVDAALVIRYFGSKQDLFAAAVDFSIELPDLLNVDPDQVAGVLTRSKPEAQRRLLPERLDLPPVQRTTGPPASRHQPLDEPPPLLVPSPVDPHSAFQQSTRMLIPPFLPAPPQRRVQLAAELHP
jgi:AcrR family transcriptional regulator